MGQSRDSFQTIMGSASVLRQLLLAALGPGLFVPACGGKANQEEPHPEPERHFVCEDGMSRSEQPGFVLCKSGTLHRVEAVSCGSRATSTSTPVPEPDTLSGPRECRVDTDCDFLPGGFCRYQRDAFGPVAVAQCVYPCLTDEECGAGMACLCAPGGQCIPAECRSQSDCPEAACVTLYTVDACGPKLPRLACWSDVLQCDSGFCSVADTGHGACIEGSCEPTVVCGRPFLVGEQERRAEVVSRNDWLSENAGAAMDLEPDSREVLASHWSRCGAMEHASIAAFSRFLLQLMSLAAPAELIDRTCRAIADETEHSRLCFSLASRYAAKSLGPGALAVNGCLDSGDLHAIVQAAFTEACIGETTAALEAAVAAHEAQDGTVKGVLLRIARDESSHAELGFAFMSWILSMNPELRDELAEPLRELLAREQERASSARPKVAEDEERTELLDHGLLPRATSAWIRNVALSSVIAPCLERLLAAAPSLRPSLSFSASL
jgi:hypothetical protein